MSKRVVIIGAGPGGLASAMLLSHAGLDVTVLERQSVVGGRTSNFIEEGFRFDLGATFFLYPQVLEEIFRATGLDLHDAVELIRLDPQYRLVFGSGGELLATPDVEEMEKAIAKISPEDAPAFRRFLHDNRVKLNCFKPCLETPFLSWRDLFRWSLFKLLPILRPWKTLDGELGRYFRDPRIRLAFSFQSKYLGMSPFRCPSLFSILSFLEYEHGVFHPRGGCGAVTQAMADAVEQLGGKVQTQEPVKEILFEGKKAVGVRTDQGEYRADALVINSDFAQSMTRFVPDHIRRRWTDKKISKKKFSCSTFMMYLGLEGLYDHVEHHTIYMAKDYMRNLEDIEQRHVLSDDPSFYVQNASVTDNTLAPKGMSTLYILLPVTHIHENVDWQREKARYRQLALKQLEKIGITDIEKRIRFERIFTPNDWHQQHQIYRGATFNLSHNLGQMLHNRPRNRFEDLQGVYLVGGGTHPGSGLPVIFESARISSRLLLEDLDVSQPTLAQSASEEIESEAFSCAPSVH